tara:strand:- start:113 stop:1294 length:1182 start_codon:yes stop_codon:yes gene_type:complete
MENKTENKSFAISNQFKLFEFGREDIGTPRIEEKFSPRDPWISFGVNNDYPQELIRLYQNADGLHSALVKKKVDMIAGMGFVDNPAYAEFLKNSYSAEDLKIISYKIAFDIVLFGGYYLNVVWDRNGTKIAKIKHVPFEKVRIAKPNAETGEVEGYYISRDWHKWRKEENKPFYVCAFNEDEQYRIEYPSQILFSKIYTPGMDYYTIPSYAPIVNYLKLSYEISTFHLKSCQNAYLPNMIITIPHVPPPLEREKMTQEIKARSGTDEAGQTVVVYGTPDKMPTFTVVNPVTSDTKFKDLMVQMNENIYVGHLSNNVIAGIAVAGKLANTSEVKEQYALFQRTVITPLQNHVEATINKIAVINGLPGDLKFKQYDAIEIDTIQPAVPNETPAEV